MANLAKHLIEFDFTFKIPQISLNIFKHATLMVEPTSLKNIISSKMASSSLIFGVNIEKIDETTSQHVVEARRIHLLTYSRHLGR